jgi:hypothetical protein
MLQVLKQRLSTRRFRTWCRKARNGYIVESMDATDQGIEKGRRLADNCGVAVVFLRLI